MGSLEESFAPYNPSVVYKYTQLESMQIFAAKVLIFQANPKFKTKYFNSEAKASQELEYVRL